MNISQLLTVSLSSQANPEIGTVVFTGITIVFFVLIILFVAITVQGVLFKSSKKGVKADDLALENSDIKTAAIAPVIEQGIPGEVVAAITAAIACMEGGSSFTVKSVKRAAVRQNAWGSAAMAEYTQPF